jgi:hypothetical protein
MVAKRMHLQVATVTGKLIPLCGRLGWHHWKLTVERAEVTCLRCQAHPQF